MMHRAADYRYALCCLAILALLVLPSPRSGAEGESEGDGNLLKNGSFEEGEAFATHWERPNGLTSSFVTEPGHGRVLRLDTRVDKEQAREWAKAFAADPSLPVPATKPVGKGIYSTIGASDGVLFDSEFIEAKPGQDYKLSADIKGPGAPFVWIKGFMFYKGRWRDAYQTRLAGEGAKPGKWQRFSIGFNPTKRSPRVTRFKVRVYAYWPNGVYFFDNLRVEEITPAEMAVLVKQRGIPKR